MKTRTYKIKGCTIKVTYTCYFNMAEVVDGNERFVVGPTLKRGKNAAEDAYETAVSLGYIKPMSF